MYYKEFNNLLKLFEGRTENELSQPDINSVSNFMSLVAQSFPSDYWLFVFNDFTSDELKIVDNSLISTIERMALMDILPVLFHSDSTESIIPSDIKTLLNSLQSEQTPKKAFQEALHTSFEVSDTESIILVFFNHESSEQKKQIRLANLEEFSRFLMLFIKSFFSNDKSIDLLTELRSQVRRLNTWMEALNWINQAKVDETQDFSTSEFYIGVLFQLKTLMHADFTAILKVSMLEKKINLLMHNGEEIDTNLFISLIVKSIKNNRFQKQSILDGSELEAVDINNISDFVFVPLYVNDNLNYVIMVARSEGVFNRDDKVIGRMFSNGVEKIIERRWFVSSIERNNLKLEKKRRAQEELIQQLKQAKDKIIENEKLASIGQLAAGVAHEINNPVGYVSSNITSMRDYLKDLFSLIEMYEEKESLIADNDAVDNINQLKEEIELDFLKEDVSDLISESLEGVNRVKKIVQDLKDFSHVEEVIWQKANIHKGLESTLNIVNNELKYKAEIIKDFDELPSIACVPSQLNQVFMNLLVNAGHAIADKGKITIKTSLLDEENICVEISDTGVGIEEKIISRIFEPFFTTKGIGKGTGLGLSISYGIIKKHSGDLTVESVLGEGTSFKIRLPIEQNKDEVITE